MDIHFGFEKSFNFPSPSPMDPFQQQNCLSAAAPPSTVPADDTMHVDLKDASDFLLEELDRSRFHEHYIH